MLSWLKKPLPIDKMLKIGHNIFPTFVPSMGFQTSFEIYFSYKQHVTQRTCVSKNKPCPCVEEPSASVDLPISKCHKGDCFTSTCKNCPPATCFWTRSFQYISETQRSYRDDGDLSHNCFVRSLVTQVRATKGYVQVKADSERKTCPTTCDSLTTCDQCVASTGTIFYAFIIFTKLVLPEQIRFSLTTLFLPSV